MLYYIYQQPKERNTMKIYHHTKDVHLDSIKADGVIKLEGSNLEQMFIDARGFGPAADQWKMCKMQYDLVGRYVWFTEESQSKSTTMIVDMPTTAIEFDTDNVQVKRWYDVGRELMKKGGITKKIVRALNETAKQSGDDPSKWWVSTQAVDLP